MHNIFFFYRRIQEMEINFRLSLINMRKVKNFKVISLSVLAFVIFVSVFSSCVRERDVDTSAAEDNLFALFVYDDAINIANEAFLLATGDHLYSYKTSGYCATVTNNPGNLVIDFDSLNCLCQDGRNRRGKILINYTGNYGDSAQTSTITFEDYYVNDNRIDGSEIITHMGSNATTGLPYQKVDVQGKIGVLDTLGTYVYNATLERTMTAGNGSIVWGDDVFELTGTAQCRDIYNNNIAMRIVTPVVKVPSLICNYLQAGTVEVQPQGRTFRSVNLGNGSCDAQATVTIDTKEHAITLR
jgi:hypothetical protein